MPPNVFQDAEDEDEASQTSNRPPDLAKMTAEREFKLKRYKEQKEIESRLEELSLIPQTEDADEDLVMFKVLLIVRY